MKKETYIISITLVFLGILLATLGYNVLAEPEPPKGILTNITLIEGRNQIALERELFVSELIYYNPLISAVSYTQNDYYENKTIGYVNVFGGIGKNFLIQPNIIYEVMVTANTTIQLPLL